MKNAIQEVKLQPKARTFFVCASIVCAAVLTFLPQGFFLKPVAGFLMGIAMGLLISEHANIWTDADSSTEDLASSPQSQEATLRVQAQKDPT